MAKTKIDLLVEKLIELTNDGYLAWITKYHEKYDYPVYLIVHVPGGEIRIPVNEEALHCIEIVDPDGFARFRDPAGLDTLVRAVVEYDKITWGTQKIVDSILSGEVENGDKGTE